MRGAGGKPPAQQFRTPFVASLASQQSIGNESKSSQPPTQPTTQHLTADTISLDLTVNNTSIRAADTLTLTLRITASSGTHIDLPALAPADTLGGLTITAIQDTPPTTIPETNQLLHERRYTLEPFLPGTYTIPALQIPWKRTVDAAEQGVLTTEPITIEVISLIPDAPANATTPTAPPPLDTGTIRDQYTPPAPPSPWWTDAGWVAAAILTGFGIAGLSVYAARRRRMTRGPRAERIDHLCALRDQTLTPADTQRITHALSATTRAILAQRHGACTQTWTSSEILEKIHQKDLARPDPAVSVDDMGETDTTAARLLMRLDDVRFSGRELPVDELHTLIDTALNVAQASRLCVSPRERERGGAE